MVDDILRCTLRVNRVLFRKFRFIAEDEGRSVNKALEQYMKQRVKKYEAANGEIMLPPDDGNEEE